MIKGRGLKPLDTVMIVSLSSGILGESYTAYQRQLGEETLKSFGLKVRYATHARDGLSALDEHPEWRAQDLIEAFTDDSVAMILCAIGGEDTLRLAPYLMTEDFKQLVQDHPKPFIGYSDTTINHLMLHRLGLKSYYGLNFLCDFCELPAHRLPYSMNSFEWFFHPGLMPVIKGSERWYEERTSFQEEALNKPRMVHENTGLYWLQGAHEVQGKLLGGCLESFADLLTTVKNQGLNRRYTLFFTEQELKESLFFLEVSEEKPDPEVFKSMVELLKGYGVFRYSQGLLFGKPQDGVYQEEYHRILGEVIADETYPVLVNVPIGHCYPKTLFLYGGLVKVNYSGSLISYQEAFVE